MVKVLSMSIPALSHDSSSTSNIKAMREAIRKIGTGSMVLFVAVDPTAETWSNRACGRLVLRSESRRDAAIREEKRAEIPCTVHVRNGHNDAVKSHTYEGRTEERYSEPFAPRKGSWYLGCDKHVSDALDGLPSTATVSFEVYLDAGTNQSVTKARLHGDHLYMVARWETPAGKPVERRFLIDACTAPHNSARFGMSSF